MKKLFLCGLILALQFGTLSAQQYVGVNFGVNDLNVTNESKSGMKMGYKAGVTYGHAFDSGFRAEAEGSFRENHYKTRYDMRGEDIISSKHYRSKQSWCLMGNVFYDVKSLYTRGFTPFIGVGAGYANNTEKNKVKYGTITHNDKLRDNGFAYQAIVGAKYPLNDLVDVGVQYHYFVGNNHQKAHNLGVSLLRNF